MTRTEILLTMHEQISRRTFRTMQLGGNTRQLETMEAEGLISSESRGGRGRDRRNWFLSDEQHAMLSFLFADPDRSAHRDRWSAAMNDRIKKLADDCRVAAEFYEKSPGLAGHGVNSGTVIDIYRRIAMALDEIAALQPRAKE